MSRASEEALRVPGWQERQKEALRALLGMEKQPKEALRAPPEKRGKILRRQLASLCVRKDSAQTASLPVCEGNSAQTASLPVYNGENYAQTASLPVYNGEN